ncbi:MAG TPA: SIMPL domain-containing protein, partial [Gemmatimonadales bacterium]|nr:SIMPL domain-containing protein [Gemmatimonadales bacterium]
AALTTAGSTGGLAQARPADTAEVRTVATAQRSIPPDRAKLTLQFTADGSTALEANQNLARRTDSVRRALATIGIPRDSILNGSRWYWWPGRFELLPHPRIISIKGQPYRTQQALDTVPNDGGYSYRPIMDTTFRAREILEVRIGDPKKVGAVIDAAVGLGITDISGIQFSATSVRAAQLEALREATARAREEAQAIAAASGGQLGRIISLGTETDQYSRFDLNSIEVRGSGDVGARTQVTAPSVTVTVSVHGRWHLLER